MLSAIIGGLLIGAAGAGMLWANGRVLGVSGIVGGLLTPARTDILWRAAFVIGIILGGVALNATGHFQFSWYGTRTLIMAAVGGILVGLGTTLGNGCTSGHGVCGVGRFSPRSLVATVTFMGTGILSVLLIHHVWGLV